MNFYTQNYKNIFIFFYFLAVPILAHAHGVFPMWFVFLYGAFIFVVGGLIAYGIFYILKQLLVIQRKEFKNKKVITDKKENHDE